MKQYLFFIKHSSIQKLTDLFVVGRKLWDVFHITVAGSHWVVDKQNVESIYLQKSLHTITFQ